MTEPYLIAHKVRGEPAFDIAIRCDDMGTESDPGPWWIIPTSGHRAYPYLHWSIKEIKWREQTESIFEFAARIHMPPDWPDHYETHAAKGEGTIQASSLLERLGMLHKLSIRRR